VSEQTDSQLLRAYVERRSEPAFAELVRRHVNIIYSAAFRMVCDSHLAEDVTQAVFVALAKGAPQLTDRPVLSSWLHRTAQNIAAQTVRTDVRRRAREQEAAAMNTLLFADSDASWEEIAPHLDAALGGLTEPDRDAVLLRYFERKPTSQMAQILGVSEEAAQKRVSRAVERLREFFAKRGITIGAGGLTLVISANAVQAAPVGLAVTISAATAFAGTTVAVASTAAATKIIAMTTLQKTVIGATVAVAVGMGIYEARQVSLLREQVKTLQQRQAPFTEQIEQLSRKREETTRQLVALRDENERLNRNTGELVRLRAEVSRLRNVSQEQAQRKGDPALEKRHLVMSVGGLLLPVHADDEKAVKPLGNLEGERAKQAEQQASNKLASLNAFLNLTPEQTQKVRGVLLQRTILNEVEPGGTRSVSGTDLLGMGRHLPMEIILMTTGMSAERAAENREAIARMDEQFQALLSPDQQSAYEQYKKDQTSTRARQLADEKAMRLREQLGLTGEQQEKVASALSDLWTATPEPSAGWNLSEWLLEQSLKIFEEILSKEQLEKARRLADESDKR